MNTMPKKLLPLMCKNCKGVQMVEPAIHDFWAFNSDVPFFCAGCRIPRAMLAVFDAQKCKQQAIGCVYNTLKQQNGF